MASKYIISLFRYLHNKVRKESDFIMPISKSKTPTKDGRCWYFRVCYKDEFNNNQRYQSKKQKVQGK